MLAEVIRELTKCREDVTIPSETVLAWAKRVEVQRVQTVVISSLCKLRNFDAISHKQNSLWAKSMQVTQSAQKRDSSTEDKSINQDDAQCMVKGVTTVARSTTLRQCAETLMSKNLASKW